MINRYTIAQEIMKPLSEEKLWEFIDGEMPEEEAFIVRKSLASCRLTRKRYRDLLKAERCILNAVSSYRTTRNDNNTAPAELQLCPSQYIKLYRFKNFKPVSAGFSAVVIFFAGLLPLSLFNTEFGSSVFQTCEASLMFCFKTPLLYFSIFTLTVVWALFIFDKLFISRNPSA
jgi:hypothetical protein